MIYVFESGSVVYAGETLTNEQKNQAVAVNELPVSEIIEGKIPVIKANLETQEVFYEYADKHKDTLEQEVDELKSVIDKIVKDSLMGGNENV